MRNHSCCKKRKSPSCPISDCCEEELQVEVQSTCGKEPPKRNSSFSCCSCCKRPKIVVPSDGGIRSESKLVHKDHSQSQHSKPNSKGKFKSNTKNCSADHQKSHANSSCNEVNKDQCHYFHLSEKPHCSSKPPPCGNCPDISDLSKQLCEMNKKLEGIQSQELGDIRHQVKCLTSNMESLAKKCVESKPPCPKLKRKASSTCQFCRGKSLPLLDSFLCQLNDAIGSLCKSDVLISVFLRADNVYHLNLRDLNSGKSLGCFLVSDCGIEEALKMGIFKDILTLSVIDVRNTIKPKNCPLGISFEFHYADRQSGGSDLKTRRNCRAGEECLACVLGIPLKSMKYVYSVPQVPEGSSGSSAPDQTLFRHQKFLSSDKVAILSDKLVLTDDDDNYVVDTLERPSLSDLEKNT
ncbi:uncharacterized protein LOC122320006 [Drosophila ficusphila]|uniref:uncharacterized protein LOC122320006 n=1 Tax=Drosophila ficusphila TaxID=30025 RepID=UPI001C893EA1|nr:uncharacterized protein LOC122320006 [Drosophila ficusphila]